MSSTNLLELLEGGRRSLQSASAVTTVRPTKKSVNRYQLDPCAGTVTTAYKATERRLMLLLEDRGRLGRDLYDGVLPALYAIGLSIATSRRMTCEQTVEAKESDDRMVGQVNQLIHEVRGMIRELESRTVQDFHLPSELMALGATYEQHGRVSITWDLQPNVLEVLTHEEARDILNIVREALSNGVRHGQATRVTVSMGMWDGSIHVSILDDGIGFSLASHRPRGYGLANMDARAKKLGGRLRVQSQPGHGTRVTASFSRNRFSLRDETIDPARSDRR